MQYFDPGIETLRHQQILAALRLLTADCRVLKSEKSFKIQRRRPEHGQVKTPNHRSAQTSEPDGADATLPYHQNAAQDLRRREPI